ncbi:hypothetical protein ACA910_005951 [Epithemia clementina (nom. ined.)]
MMLKVEAFAGGSDQAIQPTLHICLATADPETGVCLTVGRKEGLVQFEQDKSVSRRDHTILRFVSTTESAFPCQNPEQTEAVDSLHHLAVVLENQGKLGTVLVHEPVQQQPSEPKKKKAKKDDDDSATVDSAETMDDEDAGVGGLASQASSANASIGSVLSKAAQRTLGAELTKQVRLDFLGAGQSRILLPLRYAKGRVIVQCGKLGSTIIITRLDTFSFVRSGFTSKKKLPWVEKAHWFGGHEVTSWSINHNNNNDSSDSGEEEVNLLVTPSQEASSKQLAAWSRHIPIVAPSFMEALLERTDPSLPLPDPKDHGLESKIHFWKAVTPDPNLLRGTKFLSTKAHDDLELLVAAAGSTAVKLYESESPEHDIKLLQRGCYGLDVPRRKLTTLLKECNIPLVSVRTIAEVISTQNPLLIHPSFKDVVTSCSRPNNEASSTNAETNDSKVTGHEGGDDNARHKPPLRKSPRRGENIVTTEGNEPQQSLTTKSASTTNQNEGKGSTTIDLDAKETTKLDARQDSRVLENAHEASCALDKNENAEQMQMDNESDDDEIGWKRKKSKASSVAKPSEMKTQSESRSNTAMQTTKRKDKDSSNVQQVSRQKRVLTSNDGWLQVAPKQAKKRRDLVRSVDEIKELAGYDEVLPPAKTKTVRVMIGQANGETTANGKGQANERGGVPDFRAFRKNSVAQTSLGTDTNTTGTPSPSQGSYRLRVHRPKESAGEQYEFEEQRQALEEQQRRAEALFRDAGARTAAGRRRQ